MSGKSQKKATPEEILERKKAQLEALKVQCEAVEKMISISHDQGVRLGAEVTGLRRDLAMTEEKIDALDRNLDENVLFMRNFAKSNEENLRLRRDSMTRTVADAETECAELRVQLASTVQEREAELMHWEQEVDSLQSRVDEKALLFGLQLKEALANVHA